MNNIHTLTPRSDRDVTGTGAVPIGDDWMVNRFTHAKNNWSGYQQPVDVVSRSEAEDMCADSKAAAKRREKAIVHASVAVRNAHFAIADYVDEVVSLQRRMFDDDLADLTVDDGPLGDALPATVLPHLAARWADDLEAAFPRVVELVALLRRRAAENPHSDHWDTRVP